MLTLGIDTSNQPLAVGLIEGGKVLGQIQTTVQKNHSVTLMPAIDELFLSVGKTPADIDRIAVACGPGSYTGLRIGVTVAKTLAYTLNKELVGISSLKVLAANCKGISSWIVPLFNARRGNVYAGIYEWQNEKLVAVLPDQHISLEGLLDLISREQKVFFVGGDLVDFKEIILKAELVSEFNPHPLWDIPSGIEAAVLSEFEPVVDDVHRFLPRYLKRVEAEEKWLETHQEDDQNYVEKI